MKNKLILHIGTMKTGTTVIQSFLYNNRDELKKYNYSYPFVQEGRYKTMNGSPLINYILDFGVGGVDYECEGWKDYWRKIRKELKKSNVIISCEAIFNCNAIKFFSAVKNEYDNIQVIVYLRRQDRYLESLYNQFVKFDNNMAIEFKCISDSFESKAYCNYKKVLDDISSIIGKENIIIRIYEKEKFEGNRKDIISDFMYSLNININFNNTKNIKKNVNPALFGNFIDIKREMNLYCKPLDKASIVLNYTVFDYLNTRLSDEKIIHNEGLFTANERIEFLKKFEEQNREIACEYLNLKNGLLFDDNEIVKMHEICYETLVEDVKNLFNYLFKNLKDKKEFSLIYLEEMEELFYNQIKDIEKNYDNYDKLKIECFNLIKKCISLLTDYGREKYKKILYLTNKIKDKKVFIYGAGGYSKDLVHETGILPDLFLDNNKNGETIFNIRVENPNYILESERSRGVGSCFIIIAVKKQEILQSIENQLKSYNMKNDIDYIIAKEIFECPYLEGFI